MRASDSERERIVRELTQHCGDGRLTLDELEERTAEAYAATSKDDLQHVLRELPRMAVPRSLPSGPPVRVKPSAVRVRPSADLQRAGEIALRVHLYTYLSVMAFLTMIYVLTNLGGYFWPIWPAMGWGVAIAIHAGAHKAANS